MKGFFGVLACAVLLPSCVTLGTSMAHNEVDWDRVQTGESCQVWLLFPFLTVEDRPTVEKAGRELQAVAPGAETIAVDQSAYWYVLAGQ